MRAHVYPLDALRFFAALSVMFFHLTFYSWASKDSVVGHMLNHATAFPAATPFTSCGCDAFKHAGQMTYPLHLTHSVVGAFLIRAMVGAGVNAWAALATAIVTMLCVAYIIARCGEPALRKALGCLWEHAEGSIKNALALAFLFKPGDIGKVRT